MPEKATKLSENCNHDTQNKDSFKKAKCCYNETIGVDITDELSNADNSTLNQAQLTFITAYLSSSYHLFFLEEKQPDYFNYSPPLIYQNVSVLHQVFII